MPHDLFHDEFEILGLLTRFFKGGLTISDMLKMKLDEILFWYDIYELNATTEEIIKELSTDKNGNKRKLPRAEVIRQKVFDRIAERKGEEIEENGE